MKKSIDHSPHEMFVELSVLQQLPEGGLEWREKARWIKFEENIEGVENRWGKPHISYLNFSSLFSLRRGLEKGAILLDLEESEFASIASRLVDHMIACGQVTADQRDTLIKIILLRQKVTRDYYQSSRNISRAQLGIRRSLANIFHRGSLSRAASDEDEAHLPQNGVKLSSTHTSLSQAELESDLDMREREGSARNLELMKILDEGTEATAVLVGAVDFLKQPIAAFVRLAEGVVLENVVEAPIPVRFIFVLLVPFQVEMDYYEVGRSMSTLMSEKAFNEVAYGAQTRGQLLSAINDLLNASIVLPPSDWHDKDLVPLDEIRAKTQIMLRKSESIREKKKLSIKVEEPAIVKTEEIEEISPKRDPLKREGKLFYGLIEDIRIRYPQYWSDIRDGISFQVLSTCIFIFFAALSPAVTFGGMYAAQTNNLIGVGETLLASSINGIIFALFAAQPILIVGATGPLMVYDLSLMSFCDTFGLDFLSLRVWVGIWVVALGLLVTAFEVIAVVKKFTRFTEELYATLICVIFIYGAFESLVKIFKVHPLTEASSNCNADFNNSIMDVDDIQSNDNLSNVSGILINGTLYNSPIMMMNAASENGVKVHQPNTALLSLCLMTGTFVIALKLKNFRNSKYLGRSVRRALGDFGVPIAMLLMVLMDYFLTDAYTDKLTMPKGLKPSNSEVRGWLINPLGAITPLPVWCMLAAAPAAILLFILFFIEGNICQLILSKPERCLKKGTGYHLDILLCCVMNSVSGLFGAPFMSPACVRTIVHVSSLTVVTTKVPPGAAPKVIGCLEQRVSPFVVSLLIGVGVMMYSILNLVPTSVLLGVFLYMGISATSGIQFLDRIVLYFMPVKHHYNVPYVKQVRTWKMHCFTGVQLGMLAILWAVKESPASLCVPFILLCLIPLRLYIMPFIFTPQELIALDGKEQSTPEELAVDEPDFYEAVHRLPTQIEEEHHVHVQKTR